MTRSEAGRCRGGGQSENNDLPLFTSVFQAAAKKENSGYGNMSQEEWYNDSDEDSE